jgi:hypothetical protein
MSKGYNGYPSWNIWNVVLWLSNDEGAYSMLYEAIRNTRNRDEAVEEAMWNLRTMGLKETPDGAPYTKTAVRYAMREM